MTQVSALFVDPKGPYPELLGQFSCWTNGPPDHRDARLYDGADPVVAHPPCNLWCNFAATNWKRYKRQKPAWYPGGDDGGCFAAALRHARCCGGVLEHPAGSHAWKAHELLPLPWGTGWKQLRGIPNSEWVCEVWQSAYGHKARKRTWLLYCGKRPPFDLNWTRKPGTHQCGWFDRKKPTLSKAEASRTPISFAEELIRLAKWSKQ